MRKKRTPCFICKEDVSPKDKWIWLISNMFVHQLCWKGLPSELKIKVLRMEYPTQVQMPLVLLLVFAGYVIAGSITFPY